MRQTGIVKKIHENTAEVEITRSSSCGESCASCGLCPGRTALVSALNPVKANAGDTVIIDMADKKVIGAAFLVYIVPLAVLILGYFAGFEIFKKEGIAIISGFLFMAAAFWVIKRIDKHYSRRYTPVISAVIGRGYIDN